jgi:PAS domain S-box-containing protein
MQSWTILLATFSKREPDTQVRERLVVNSANQKTKRWTQISGGFAIAAGITVLTGWTLQLEILKSILTGFIAMNPLTATCFVAAGLCLCLQCEPTSHRGRIWASRVCAIGIILVSTARLGDYLLGWEVGLDGLMFAATLGDNVMAPNTAACFLFTAFSLLTLDWTTVRGYWPAQLFAILIGTFALISLIGYGYGAVSLYQVTSYIPMALNTAFVFQILSLGLLFSRPDRGLGSVLFHDGLGGLMARRLLPVGIAIPCVLGWLRVWGQRAGWYETEFGAAFMVAVTVIIFSAAVCWIAGVLNRTDDQRQSASRELARSNQEIRDLYDNAPCGYHSLDANGVFIAVNKTELSWLGYTRNELLGKMTFADVISPNCRSVFAENFTKFKKDGEVKDLEFEILRKNGTTLPVVLSATAITDSNGEFIASRTTLFDATERRKVEKTFRSFNAELEKRVNERTTELKTANSELQEKNQENEMFVYSVSHDLRSPLVNLQGFSQELMSVAQHVREILTASHMPAEMEDQATQLIDDDMQRCIRFIQTSVSRLSGIIDALLRLSRAGRVEYEPQIVDLNQVATRVIEAMSSVAYDRGVSIELASLPPAWGDPTALEQIFANLIGNAVNYLDPQRPGQIEVGSFPAECTLNSTTYFVKDNGLGIAEAYHCKIFQALKRLHPKATQGEGIGLALVKRIVERHGGTIWFESAAGQGTTFYVNLPNVLSQGMKPTEAVILPEQEGKQYESETIGNLVG